MGTIKVDSYPSSFLQRLHELQMENKMCDTSLKTGQEQILVHRLVLQAASPRFQPKLNKINSTAPDEMQVICCDGVPKPILQTIVLFMYSGCLDVESHNKEHLYRVCNNFKLTEATEVLNERFPGIADSHVTEFHTEEDIMDDGSGGCLENSERKPAKRKYVTSSCSNKEDTEPEIKRKSRRNKKPRSDDKDDIVSFKTKQIRNKKEMSHSNEVSLSLNASKSQTTKSRLKKARQKKTVKKRKPVNLKSDKSTKSTIQIQNHEFECSDSNKEKESVEKINSDDSHSKDCSDIYIDNAELGDENKTDDEVGEKKTKRKGDLNGNKAKKKNPKTKEKYKRKKYQFPCQKCDRILSNRHRLAFHEFNKHGIAFDEEKYSMYPCKQEGCSYVAATKHNLETHRKSKHGAERPHICEFCGKGFKLPNVLATHLNLHTGLKKWECETCGDRFNQQSGLDIHVKRHHMGDSSWVEKCHLCSEKYLQKSDLAWHLFKAHDQPLPDRYTVHSCTMCSFSTKSKQDLKRHYDAHQGIKQFFCSICQKRCTTKSELRRHMGFHGEKKYRCIYEGCSYASTDSTCLVKHTKLMHTHKNYKPWLCPVCPYRTGLKGNLDKHIRSVHNLEVVTKHTIKLKMKYANFESGDIITKEGQLVASAKERSALQAEYKAQNADSVSTETKESNESTMTDAETPSPAVSSNNTTLQAHRNETVPDVNGFKMEDDTIGTHSVQTGLLASPLETYTLECDKSTSSIAHVGATNNVDTSHNDIDSVERKNDLDLSDSTDGGSELQELTPITNYIYLDNAEPVSSPPVSVIAEDLRMSIGAQISLPSDHYSISQSENCVRTGLQF